VQVEKQCRAIGRGDVGKSTVNQTMEGFVHFGEAPLEFGTADRRPPKISVAGGSCGNDSQSSRRPRRPVRVGNS